MDPITAGVALLKFVPDILHLFGKDNQAKVAEKVVGIAQAVTGEADPGKAVAAIQADPAKVLEFQRMVQESKVKLEEIAAQRAKDEAEADNRADELLTQRMATLEGTAVDLKGIPYLGPLMLFLRGSQRIVIGYGTVYIDGLWLLGLITPTDPQVHLLTIASLLVFSVIFGERAIKNAAPLVAEMIRAWKGGK